MHVNRYGPIQAGMTRRGLGQDTPAPSTYSVAAGPPEVSPSDLQAQVTALQGQTSATADVVASILASSPSVQTTPGIATSSSNSTMYVLLALVAAVAIMGAVKS